MSKNPTNFSRDFIKTAVEYNIADPSKLRDYDILKDRERGMTHGQLAIKYNLTRVAITRIISKY